MTQSTFVEDEMFYIEACKQSLADGVHYVLAKYNPDKGTVSISFHNSPSTAGLYLLKTYGVDGLASLHRGRSNIKRIYKDNSRKYGISTSPVKITFEFH
jgi:hypothetical protein